jgi:hypothetical protein
MVRDKCRGEGMSTATTDPESSTAPMTPHQKPASAPSHHLHWHTRRPDLTTRPDSGRCTQGRGIGLSARRVRPRIEASAIGAPSQRREVECGDSQQQQDHDDKFGGHDNSSSCLSREARLLTSLDIGAPSVVRLSPPRCPRRCATSTICQRRGRTQSRSTTRTDIPARTSGGMALTLTVTGYICAPDAVACGRSATLLTCR